MPHPIPPPKPPSIVQTLPPEVLRPTTTSVPAVSATQSVTTKTLSGESTARALEPSPLSAATSAALLGPPISVGYPVKAVETTNASAAPPRSNQLLPSDGVSTASAGATLKGVIAPETTTSPNQTERALPSTKAPIRDTSESPNPQPAELNLLAPIETQPVTSPIPVQQPVPTQLPSTPQRQPLEQDSLPSTPPVEEQRQPVEQSAPAPVPTSPSTPQSQSQPPGQSPPPSTPPVTKRIIELTSDRQEYDLERQIVTAEGNVLLRSDGAVVDADRLQVNVQNLIVVGEGNVALTRGGQVVRGKRFTYNFIQDSGELLSASGEIYIPTAGSDFAGTLPTDVTAGAVPPRPPSDRITANQPLQQVTSPGGLVFNFGGTRNVSNISVPPQGGEVKRVRFQAERIDFYPEGWQARNIRLTNDPFSPPELEVEADTATLTRETPLRSRIRTTRQRLVFDQGLSLPIPKNQAVIDRSERDTSPGLAQIGYDGEDRGGLFIQRTFTPINTEQFRLSLTPQFFAQQAVQDSGGNVFDPALYGLKASLDATLGPHTTVRGSAVFTSLNLNDVEDNLRGSLRLRQTIGNRLPHTLTTEYSYRDRLYNGSLGFQTVQSSLGGILTSPVIPLGKTGINLSYQAGAQYITANTDRLDLLEPVRENNRTSLSRFQGSAALNRGFLLWQGKALPATATEGLRYTPAPVVPYVLLFTGVTGTSGFYSNGDNQSTLTGTIGVQGQFGHFSRSFFDYTGFFVSYSQSIRNGTSPFLFDRAADTRVLTAGFSQQIYGPLRLGLQVSLNLDTGENYSTDYILEYSRRTYGVILRYNPDQALGALSLRISDFNWTGGSNPFSDSEVLPVVNGVRRDND